MDRPTAFWLTTFVGIAGLLGGPSPGFVDAHVYLVEPVSRNFYYTSAFQDSSFEDITYCPHCYQSRGPMAVRQRAEENTPSDVLSRYGDGDWPLRAAYNLGEVAGNGNYLENQQISVRHGICGDPEQTAAEGTNTFGRANSVYPVLDTYEEGGVIEMKMIISTYHWGHMEFFICNGDDLDDAEGSVVTQECFNMNPLTRASDDGDASPIDPAHPGRYFLDPPCREAETDQDKPDGATAGYMVTGRYQLPKGLSCERCTVQMIYYTGNSCRHPGYEEFETEQVPEGCAPHITDWITLGPPPCGEGFPYPEEFWNCADIAITPSDVNPCLDSSGENYKCSGKTINLNNCELTDDDADDVRACFEAADESKIKNVKIKNNDFTTLPEDLFDGMTSMELLDIRRNCDLTCLPPLPSEDVEVLTTTCSAGALDELCVEPEPTPAPTPAPVVNTCVDPVSAWGQCGGGAWAGPTCCDPGYECVDVADSYSQCQPADVDDGCSAFWGQCDGSSWSGPTCCNEGSQCEFRNEGYSQCVPESNALICSTLLIPVEL